MNLANAYYNGYGVRQDSASAAEWFHKAADQGNAAAQSHLGDMYYLGEGVKQDDAEAVAWYRKAADQGSPEAKAILPLLIEKTASATTTSSASRAGASHVTRASLSPQS